MRECDVNFWYVMKFKNDSLFYTKSQHKKLKPNFKIFVVRVWFHNAQTQAKQFHDDEFHIFNLYFNKMLLKIKKLVKMKSKGQQFQRFP